MNDIFIPPEWAPHSGIYCAWPSHPELWRDYLDPARVEIAAMVRALATGDSMRVLACGADAEKSANEAVGDLAEVIPAHFGDIWLRDTGPIFALKNSESATPGANRELLALRFETNGWGGKYQLAGDDSVGDVIARHAGAEIRRNTFVLEGGALEHNGDGCILTTRQCLLNPNRNSGWNEELANRRLGEATACRSVWWLDEGLLNDHTDGHVDNLARFIRPDTILCQHSTGPDDPNSDRLVKIFQALVALGLQVVTLPSPGRVLNRDGNVMPASHMNYIIGNRAVVVPVYNSTSGAEAVNVMQGLFPNHNVVGLPSSALLTGGGSFHCITQQVPAYV